MATRKFVFNALTGQFDLIESAGTLSADEIEAFAYFMGG